VFFIYLLTLIFQKIFYYMNRFRNILVSIRMLASIVAFFLLAEICVRAMGMVDFPLYDANSKIGYIPSVNQRGSFLNINDWEFNELHMGASAFKPNQSHDVLLVGDSIVYGGNHLKQNERLGPRLQDVYRGGVWPISAGSWALRNELAYLRMNPKVPANVKKIVFVLNSGDFGDTASSWACESTHPRTRPRVAMWYLFNKYIYSLEKCGDTPLDLEVPYGNLETELKSFMMAYSDKSVFVLYPSRSELLNIDLAKNNFEKGVKLLQTVGAAHIVHVNQDKRWNTYFYRDDIHPSAEGNQVLALIITNALGSY